MAVTPLKVTGETSVKDLQSFAAQVGKGDTIHGKTHKDGSVTLYVSKEGKGTGLKDYLFGTTATRRAAASSAITQILFANTAATSAGKYLKGELGDDFTMLLGDLKYDGSGLSGAKLKELASIAKDSYDAKTLPDKLPIGVTVDGNGNLGGGQTLTHVPSNASGFLRGYPGQSIETALTQSKSTALSDPTRFVAAGNQRITNQASNDFWRLDYTIPQGAGSFRSRDIASEDQGERNEAVTMALRGFAGSDSATTVLSEAMSQTTLIPLPQLLKGIGGGEIRYDFPSAFSGNGKDLTLRNANGSHTKVEPENVGGAKYVLSRQGNDFKISVEWQMYAQPKHDAKESLPLHEDGVVGIKFNADFIINGASAHNGQLQISIPGGVQTEFSGRVSI